MTNHKKDNVFKRRQRKLFKHAVYQRNKRATAAREMDFMLQIHALTKALR